MKREILRPVLRSAKEIGFKEFWGREDLVDVALPENVTSIGILAFVGCKNLRSVKFPKSLKAVGSDAFYATALSEVLYDGTVEEFDRIQFSSDWCEGRKPVVRCSNGTIDFGAEPFYVKELAFDGTKADWAKRYAPGHWLNRRVAVVHCTDGDIRRRLPQRPVRLATKGDWTFFEGTEYVPYDFERNIPSARTLAIPASVSAIAGFLDAAEAPFPAHAFDPFPRLREIRVDPENRTFESRDGVLYTKGGGTLLYAPDPERRTFRVPDETSEIGFFAFDACPRLEAFEVSPNHPSLVAFDGVLFSRDARTLVRVPPAWRGALSFDEDREPGRTQTMQHQIKWMGGEPVRVAPGAFRGCRGLSGLSFARLPVPADFKPEDGPEDFSWWFDGFVTDLSLLSGLREFTAGGGTFDLDAKPPRLRQLEALKTPKPILDNERRAWAAAKRARAKRLGPRPRQAART